MKSYIITTSVRKKQNKTGEVMQEIERGGVVVAHKEKGESNSEGGGKRRRD